MSGLFGSRGGPQRKPVGGSGDGSSNGSPYGRPQQDYPPNEKLNFRPSNPGGLPSGPGPRQSSGGGGMRERGMSGGGMGGMPGGGRPQQPYSPQQQRSRAPPPGMGQMWQLRPAKSPSNEYTFGNMCVRAVEQSWQRLGG